MTWNCVMLKLRISSGNALEVSWQSMDSSSTCRECLLSIGTEYKVCGKTSLWETLACTVVGQSASCWKYTKSFFSPPPSPFCGELHCHCFPRSGSLVNQLVFSWHMLSSSSSNVQLGFLRTAWGVRLLCLKPLSIPLPREMHTQMDIFVVAQIKLKSTASWAFVTLCSSLVVWCS